MSDKNVIKVLRSELDFTDSSIHKLKLFHDCLLDYNKKYNLISKSTENNIWLRHILDSAQILKFLDSKKEKLLNKILNVKITNSTNYSLECQA